MKILLLEDNLKRVDWFHKNYPHASFCGAWEPWQAIEFLKIHNDFDKIFLDHDLLPEHYNHDTICNKTTGLCVAEWLSANENNNPDAEIILHSRNWNGVGRMVSTLVYGDRKVTCYPFHKMSGLYL